MTTCNGKFICVWLGCFVAAVLACLAAGMAPADVCAGRVKISISNLPAGTAFASMACEKNGEIQSMNWVVSTALVPSEMHPAQGNWSYQMERSKPQVDWNAFVAWREGDRYGVVTWDAQVSWRIAWFSHDVCQGEFASFDSSQATSVRLNEVQVKALGLHEVTSDLLR